MTNRSLFTTWTEALSLSSTAKVPADGMDVTPYAGFSVSFEFSHGGGTAAGNVKLQTSGSGGSSDAVWSDYPGSTLNFTAATTNHQIEVLTRRFRYVRAVVTNTGGSGGTVAIKFFGQANQE